MYKSIPYSEKKLFAECALPCMKQEKYVNGQKIVFWKHVWNICYMYSPCLLLNVYFSWNVIYLFIYFL